MFHFKYILSFIINIYYEESIMLAWSDSLFKYVFIVIIIIIVITEDELYSFVTQ